MMGSSPVDDENLMDCGHESRLRAEMSVLRRAGTDTDHVIFYSFDQNGQTLYD